MKHIQDVKTTLRTVFFCILPFAALMLFYYIAGNRYGYMGFAMYFLFHVIVIGMGFLCFWAGRRHAQKKASLPCSKEDMKSGIFHVMGIIGILCVDVLYTIFLVFVCLDAPVFLLVFSIWGAFGLAYLQYIYWKHHSHNLSLIRWLAPSVLTLLIYVMSLGMIVFGSYQVYLCVQDISYLKEPNLVELNDVTYTYHRNRKSPGNYIVKGYAWTGKELRFDIGATKPPSDRFTYAKIRYLPHTRCVIELYVLER